MGRKYTTKEFIRRAAEVHNNEYDYSLTEFLGSYNQIIVICPKHGQFSARACAHLRGHKCKKCSRINRLETNLKKYGVKHPLQNNAVKEKYFSTNLEKYGVKHPLQSSQIHEKYENTCMEKYGVNNVGACQEVRNKREQTNLQRYGSTNVLLLPHFQQKVRETIVERYGHHHTKLPEIQNKRKQTNLQKYGVEFPIQTAEIKTKTQTTNLKKYGVPSYSQCTLKDVWDFIQDVDWLYEQYVTYNKTAVQIAQELDISVGTVGRYLKRAEIDIRHVQTFSLKCCEWLNYVSITNNIDIIHAGNSSEYVIPTTRFKADGFCEETNTIYEFYGNYWHGNPTKFVDTEFNESTNCTFGELYRKTIERENKIKALGYNLVVMWEDEWDDLQFDTKCTSNFNNCRV